MASGGSESAGEYITHHLTNWCIGCNPATHQPDGLIDWTAFNIDVIFISTLFAIGLIALAWFMRRRWSVDNPGRFQYTLEFIVEYIGDQIREVFPKANNYVGAMALTIFLWVF